ncbi:MAG: hypothetical protein IPL62_10980 [Caulobacteraceae bacterium]|nr:hypothetical protein [Caulobacteraceae bacterium]
MKRLILASVALAALAAAPAAAQVAEPRAVAENVAAAIEENFFDEARAHTIAADVRAAAAAGRYDIPNEVDLAAALTATLHPHDGHFRVEYRPPQPNAPARPNGGFGNDARAAYGIPNVTMYPGGIGVVDFRLLADFDPDHFQAKYALDAAFTMVHGSQALILDLRDCAGGSPTMVGYIVGHFFPDGANVYNTFHSRRGDQDESPPEQPASGRRLDTPLFVLTSGRTGSACESVAYTLQAAGRATIVGEASAGGANPGGLLPVGDNLAVFVSFGTPVNPITGRNWEGAGVQPMSAHPSPRRSHAHPSRSKPHSAHPPTKPPVAKRNGRSNPSALNPPFTHATFATMPAITVHAASPSRTTASFSVATAAPHSCCSHSAKINSPSPAQRRCSASPSNAAPATASPP